PFLLPIEPATGLATPVGRALAPQVVEQDRVLHSQAPRGLSADRVADLLHPAGDREPPARVLEHLGHERHRLHRRTAVKAGKDLGSRTHLDHVPGPQSLIAHAQITLTRRPCFRSGSPAEPVQAGHLARAPRPAARLRPTRLAPRRATLISPP